MRRPFVISTAALALALLPAVGFAQTPAGQQPAQPPAGQQPAQPPAGQAPPAPAGQAQPAPAAAPAAAKVPFTSPAGVLLVQIKPDQTAVFEEMVGKLKAGLAKTEDATLKQQASGLKVFKASEPMGPGNALYVVMIEPAVPNAEYEFFAMLQKTMTPDELRAPEAAEMWKRYAGAFAAGLSKLSLTPVQ
jgi:hypothetical protein